MLRDWHSVWGWWWWWRNGRWPCGQRRRVGTSSSRASTTTTSTRQTSALSQFRRRSPLHRELWQPGRTEASERATTQADAGGGCDAVGDEPSGQPAATACTSTRRRATAGLHSRHLPTTAGLLARNFRQPWLQLPAQLFTGQSQQGPAWRDQWRRAWWRRRWLTWTRYDVMWLIDVIDDVVRRT